METVGRGIESRIDAQLLFLRQHLGQILGLVLDDTSLLQRLDECVDFGNFIIIAIVVVVIVVIIIGSGVAVAVILIA